MSLPNKRQSNIITDQNCSNKKQKMSSSIDNNTPGNENAGSSSTEPVISSSTPSVAPTTTTTTTTTTTATTTSDKESIAAPTSKDESKPGSDFQSIGEAASLVDDMVANPEFGARGEGIRNTNAADSEGHPVQEIESMCVNCEQNGTTRLLLTKIPFFREVIIMSFSCPHCGLKNSEIQPAGQIQEKGSKYVLRIEDKKDLNREVVKSESCSCKFAELDIEIPPKRGQLTTAEGLLTQIKDDLSGDQPARKHIDPNLYDQIEEVLKKLQSAINGEIIPLTLIVDDPAGNSWIEFVPNEASHKWSHIEYFRSNEQNEQLGLSLTPADGSGKTASTTEAEIQPFPMSVSHATEYVPMGTTNTSGSSARNQSQAQTISEESEIENLNTEVQTFTAGCPVCHELTPTHMKIVNIPHFKDVILMSTVCDHCGYKSNEVKTGGAIPEKGRKISLKVTDPEDLSRDILKSESAGLQIPELHLDLTPGTLGGRFTTLEGLLRQVHDELETKVYSETSDSMSQETKHNWGVFLARLEDAAEGKIEFTVEIVDPLAGSYIQNPYAPDPDPYMTVEDYERTDEQNEDLGLNDMVTD